jgi:hypothetical protein
VVCVRIGVLALVGALLGAPVLADGPKQLLWGDTHLHTSYSFDAFLNLNLTADPDVAYRFAKGMPVIHPYNRARVQLRTPLDFLVVSDHAEFLGGIRDIYYNGIQQEDANFFERLWNWYRTRTMRNAIDADQGNELFVSLLPVSEDPVKAAAAWRDSTRSSLPGAANSLRSAWLETTRIADKNNEPGRFTALIGWEWSSVPGGANLHRVVVTDADAATAQKFLPFGSNDSPYPEDLWAWLETTSSTTGANFVAIPHNSNISKGMMFTDRTLRGEPITAQSARTRMKWERVVEVTQIKGTSETHPLLSPNDEFADFELYPYYIQQQTEPYVARRGDFVRPALEAGLSVEAQVGVNPFKFGLIGSTDSHAGLSSAEENNFWGKMARDSVPEKKIGKVIGDGPSGWSMSASGLAAVWAESNTRSAILQALQRREVYATTGPRIRVQCFGGWSFSPDDLAAVDRGTVGRAKGVPMGGDLPPAPDGSVKAPNFLIAAMKDPLDANLDRVQVVKGWLDATGNQREQVFDVVWSGDRSLDASGRLPPVGDTVDRKQARYTNTIGAAELAVVWTDPAFEPSQRAFYYVRVLQIPTPRHALYDAIALSMDAPTEGPAVIQERAFTSPIWYTPQATGS